MKQICSVTAICLLFLLPACKKEAQNEKPSVTPTANKTLREAIIHLGISDSAIQDMGDYYAVEGDIAFYKSDSALYTNSKPITNGKVSHQRTANMVNFFISPQTLAWKRRYVRVFVNAALTSGIHNWRDATLSAIEEWNKIPNCGIFLTYAYDEANADIIVRPDNGSLGSSVLANATYTPSNGDPGKYISINTDYATFEIGYLYKKFNIVHEIGHCLGFYHTDSADGWTIPNTGADVYSVMRSNSASTQWTDFAPSDKTAFSVMYPLPAKNAIPEIPGTYAAPETGYMPITWDPAAFPGVSTVIIDLYTGYTGTATNNFITYNYKRNLAIVPNTGYLAEGLNYATDHSYDLLAINIRSSINFTQQTWSNLFPIDRD